MKIAIVYLTRRSRGGVARREESLEAPQAHIGRDAAAEVFLADPRILLQHALIEPAPDGSFIVRAIGNADLRIDGQLATSARLAPGSSFALGPYRLQI